MRTMRRTTLALWSLTALSMVPSAVGQNTWRLSVDSAGVEGDEDSIAPSISRDGRFVAFFSRSSNLVPGDTNGLRDVFVRDRLTETTVRVSVDSAGNQADGDSSWPHISADGRYVLFSSEATNLVAGDLNATQDVFLHDRTNASTIRVSVNSAGLEADGWSDGTSISADNGTVAFHSLATNLVAGDTNRRQDCFVRELATGITTRVSIRSNGNEGRRDSYSPTLSRDGQRVAFSSDARNLVQNDNNGYIDVFVHDRQTATTTRVSVDSAGNEGTEESEIGMISADGSTVAFHSFAGNLVSGDHNGWWDVFAHDIATGETTLVSATPQLRPGNHMSRFPSISADGRYVSFQSLASNLIPNDDNDERDVFLRDRLTDTTVRVSVSSAGAEGDRLSWRPAVSGDGRFVVFDSEATTLVAGDNNRRRDVFVHGPHLTLDAPDVATSGQTVTLTTWRGEPGEPALLAAVEIDSTPLWAKVAIGAFDASGRWSVVNTVPPGLAGRSMTLQGYGIAPGGGLEPTNRTVVTFQ